jgi:hypothetical protein
MEEKERKKEGKEGRYIYIYIYMCVCVKVDTRIALQLILYPIHISRKHIIILGKLQKCQGSKSGLKICSLGKPENQRFRMKLREYLNLS